MVFFILGWVVFFRYFESNGFIIYLVSFYDIRKREYLGNEGDC